MKLKTACSFKDANNTTRYYESAVYDGEKNFSLAERLFVLMRDTDFKESSVKTWLKLPFETEWFIGNGKVGL